MSHRKSAGVFLLFILIRPAEGLELAVVPDVAVLRGQGRTVVLTLPALRRGQTLKYLHLPVLPLGDLELVVVVDGGGGGALDGGVQLPVRGL